MKRVVLVVFVVALSGCAALQNVWYGCNTGRWRGWDYERACLVVNGAVSR